MPQDNLNSIYAFCKVAERLFSLMAKQQKDIEKRNLDIDAVVQISEDKDREGFLKVRSDLQKNMPSVSALEQALADAAKEANRIGEYWKGKMER